MTFPDASHNAAAVQHAYGVYVQVIVAAGRVPASLEVIQAESRAHPAWSTLEVLDHKRATLTP